MSAQSVDKNDSQKLSSFAFYPHNMTSARLYSANQLVYIHDGEIPKHRPTSAGLWSRGVVVIKGARGSCLASADEYDKSPIVISYAANRLRTQCAFQVRGALLRSILSDLYVNTRWPLLI